MSFARKTTLRASVNRKMKAEGEFVLTTHCLEVAVTKIYPVSDKRKNLKACKAGDVVIVETTTKVQPLDRVMTIKYPAELYKSGLVSGVPILDEDDEMQILRCVFTALEDTSLENLSPIRIYIEGSQA